MDSLAFGTPTAITGIGLVVSLAGATCLAVDALAPKEFAAQLQSADVPGKTRMTRLGFISEVNRTFVFLFVAVGGVLGLSLVIPTGAALILGPFVFFAWQILIRLSTALDRAVTHLSPRPAVRLTQSVPGCFLYTLWAVPWAVLKVTVSMVSILIRFGVDLPFRSLAEYVVAPLVRRLLSKLAEIQEREARWGFRALAFRGILMLMIGFLYQLIGLVWGALA